MILVFRYNVLQLSEIWHLIYKHAVLEHNSLDGLSVVADLVAGHFLDLPMENDALACSAEFEVVELVDW